MPQRIKIAIGGVGVSIRGDLQEDFCKSQPAYRQFLSKGQTDITLRLHRNSFKDYPREKVFDCHPIWSLHQDKGKSAVKIFSEFPGHERTLVFSHKLRTVDLYFDDETGPLDPFYGPTLELLMIHFLALGKGVIVHACGIERNKSSILFVGESGAGKSTMARLWHKEKGIHVLSDDRIIVRRKGKDIWIYGTPWHGDGKFASPRRAKLGKIFFIRHGKRNATRKINETDSVSRFLTCSFPPLWDSRGMALTLDFFAGMSSRVPCYELGFKPDKSIVEFLNGKLE